MVNVKSFLADEIQNLQQRHGQELIHCIEWNFSFFVMQFATIFFHLETTALLEGNKEKFQSFITENSGFDYVLKKNGYGVIVSFSFWIRVQYRRQ